MLHICPSVCGLGGLAVREPLATPGGLEVNGESRSLVPGGRFTCEVSRNLEQRHPLTKTRASLQVSTLQIPKCTLKKKTLESFFSVTESGLRAVCPFSSLKHPISGPAYFDFFIYLQT